MDDENASAGAVREVVERDILLHLPHGGRRGLLGRVQALLRVNRPGLINGTGVTHCCQACRYEKRQPWRCEAVDNTGVHTHSFPYQHVRSLLYQRACSFPARRVRPR